MKELMKKEKENLEYKIYEIIYEALPVDKLGRDLAVPTALRIIRLLIDNKLLQENKK